ncbi:hypothetical protein [Streptomyces sp. NPDC002328]|uniref:hypothetical protein n=1 Tax=Streptomyces sp. NPDC002328 TaxID=3364642 RepID=UPI00368D804B
MSTTTASALSAECTLAKKPGYGDVHAMCRRLDDVPLPHAAGILLVARCGCTCHRTGARS